MKEPVKAVIMGDGCKEYLTELKALAEGLNIEFRKYKKDALADIAAVDVVVLPSLEGEGLSRIVIEAMAMGKIVVASDLVSNREALGEESKEFIFPRGDDAGLAAVLSNIAANRQIIRKNRDNIRRRAELLFDVRKNTLIIEDIYRSLLSK
jgi:glycosyltransferase involved in cell wall biosynthesis